MADQEDDENYFSDDGLDGLPQSTLQELEQRAISSTQQQIAALRVKQRNQAVRPYKLSVPSNGWQQPVPSRITTPAAHEPPSSDYGLDDEDVIDLDEPSLANQSNAGPPQRLAHTDLAQQVSYAEAGYQYDQDYNQDHNQDYKNRDYNQGYIQDDHQDHTGQDPNLHYHDDQQQSEFQQPARGYHAQPELSALEIRVKELEQERVNLQKSVQDAETAALKKAGEIAIIRAKHDKDAKDFERRIAVMQKLHADQAAKHRAETHAARKDREKVETNNRFLEHDLAQEVERTKRIKATSTDDADARPRAKTKHLGPSKTTTGTTHNLPYRDGFDDNEIMLVSPNKGKEKAKAEIPKAGDKRKRNVTASPGIPLRLTAPVAKSPVPVADPEEVEVTDVSSVYQRDEQDSRLQMIQRILNHRPLAEEERSLETLTRYAYPSSLGKSIAGLIIDKLSALPSQRMGEEVDTSLTICNHLLDMWSRCLEERYYSPLYLLLDLLEFMLVLAPRPTHHALIERLVPLATKSIDLIVIPLTRPIIRPVEDEATVDKKKEKIEEKARKQLCEEVNVNQALSILHNMAMSAAQTTDTCQTFWQTMEFDFTLLMLNKRQELPHIQLVLQMVASSVLAESFGVISAQPEKQATLETHTIDRLTTSMFERPIAPSDQPPYDDIELSSLQIEALRALSAIGSTTHGSIALAQHKVAIGRLFRFLHIQVTMLYDLPQATWKYGENGLEALEPSEIQKLTTTLISLTTRLLHHLLCHHGELINMRDKLAVIYGGHHKFIVSLTRLAFSEPLVYEAGIEEEVLDAAHDILDAVVNPDEAEGILEAIETPRGTTATRTSTSG